MSVIGLGRRGSSGFRSGISILALEPRMMFDGAAIATVADHALDNASGAEGDAQAVASAAAAASETAGNGGRKEVAFVDAAIADYQSLVDAIRPGIEVVVIESGQSGLDRMAQWAETHSGYDAIHVLSHGSEGALYLGRDTVTGTSLSNASAQSDLAVLGNALTADGDLLIYGCSVGSGEAGRDFIDGLAALTGADVAASENLTGDAALGGDWILEAASGSIDTSALQFYGTYQAVLVETTTAFDGTLTTDNTFHRPWTPQDILYASTGNATDTSILYTGNDISQTSSGAYNYSAVSFTPTADGSFTLTVTAASFTGYPVGEAWSAPDTFVSVYTGSFDPASPLTNLSWANDDTTHNSVYPSNLPGLSLTAGTQYILVVTTYFANMTGSYTLTATGPSGGTFAGVGAGPTATNDSGSATEAGGVNNGTAGSNATGNVLTNDTGATSVTAVRTGSGEGAGTAGTVGQVLSGSYGDLTLNSDGTYSYAVNNSNATVQALAAGATLTDSFNYTMSDGGLTDVAVLTVTITGANDNPAVATNTGATVNEGATAQTITNAMLAVSDVDTAASARTFTVVTAPANGTLYKSGVALAASGTFTQDDIDNSRITYSHDGGETTSDSVVFTVADGAGGTIGNTTFTLTISAVNDAPAFAGLNGAPAFTEGGTAVRLDSDVTVADAELGATMNGASLTLVRNGGASATDVLGFDTTGANFTVSGTNLQSGGQTFATFDTTSTPGQMVITFSGAQTDATSALVAEVMQRLTYSSSSDTPSATAQIDWTFSDGNSGAQGSGGAKTATGSTTVTITAVNDAPSFSGLDATPSVNEQTAITLDANVTITDAEQAASTYNGASLTIARNGGANAADTYGFDTSGATFTVSGGNLQSGGQTFATFTSVGGTLTVSFTGSGTNATGALVNEVMQRVQYTNSSDNPDSSVQLDWSFSDGNSGSQGTGGALTASGSTTLTVTAVNDAPVIGTNSAMSAQKGGVATITTTYLNESDPDDAGAGLTYTVTTTTVNGSLWVDADGSGTINDAEAALVDTGTFTQQDLTDGKLKYLHNGSATATDSFAFSLADGGEDGVAAATGTFNLDIVSAPELDLSGATAGTGNAVSFQEGDARVSLVAADATLIDADSANLNQLVVTLTNAQSGDAIKLWDGSAYRASGATVTGITITYDDVNNPTTITLSGTATKADYLALMKEAVFLNGSDALNTTARTITFAGRDDAGNTGPSQTVTITVTAVNDAPSFGAGQSLAAVDEDTASPSGATVSTLVNATFSDPDGTGLGGIAIVGDAANSSTEGAWQYTTDGGTNWYAVSGTAVSTSAALVLQNDANVKLRFVPVANYNGTPGSLTVHAVDTTHASWTSGATRATFDTTTDDASSAVSAAGISLGTSVTAVNDAPTLSATGANPNFTEGGSAVALFSGAAVGTVEAGQSIAELRVTVSNVAAATEFLTIDGTNVALSDGTTGTTTANSFGYSVAVASGTATVTITKADTAASYQTLVDALAYGNTAADVDANSRVVTLTYAKDNGGTANGGADANSSLSVASTVTNVNVNDAPTLSATAASPTHPENSATGVAPFSGSTFSAVETGQNIGQLVFTVSNLADSAAETVVLDGTAIALVDGTSGTTTGAGAVGYAVSVTGTTATVTLTKAASAATWNGHLDGLKYKNTSDSPTITGGRVFTITSVKDAGGTSNGGVDTNAAPGVAASTITLTAVNDAPTVTTGSASLMAGESVTLSSAHLAEGDPDDSGAGVIYTVTTLPSRGSLTKDGVALGVGDTFTQADIDTGLIKYQSTGTTAGTDGFTFTIADDGGAQAVDGQTISFELTAAPNNGGANNDQQNNDKKGAGETGGGGGGVVGGGGTEGNGGGGDNTGSTVSVVGGSTQVSIAQPLPPPPVIRSDGPTFTRPTTPGGFQVAVMASGGRAGGQAEGLVVNRGMNDTLVPVSGQAVVAIPPDAFAHTDPNAAVQLAATQVNGQPLPNWVAFDPQTGKFTVQPPPGVQGVVTIKVVARDDNGKEAVTTFKIVVGGQRNAGQRTGALMLGKPGLLAQMKDFNNVGRLAAGRLAVLDTVRPAANG